MCERTTEKLRGWMTKKRWRRDKEYREKGGGLEAGQVGGNEGEGGWEESLRAVVAVVGELGRKLLGDTK